jgi:hypothetical protein
LRPIDPYPTSIDLGAVECERLLGALSIGVRDEPEPTGLAGISVQDDAGIGHVTELGEHLLEALVVHRPRQAADEQFCRHLSASRSRGSFAPFSQGTDADCQRQPTGCVGRRNFSGARIEQS